MKRVLAIFLTLIMAVCYMPTGIAFAAEGQLPDEGIGIEYNDSVTSGEDNTDAADKTGGESTEEGTGEADIDAVDKTGDEDTEEGIEKQNTGEEDIDEEEPVYDQTDYYDSNASIDYWDENHIKHTADGCVVIPENVENYELKAVDGETVYVYVEGSQPKIKKLYLNGRSYGNSVEFYFIIRDYQTLNLSEGLRVGCGNVKLYIYAQEKGNGVLNANADDSAAIGSATLWDNGCREIEIHGGNINASSRDGAGIGSGGCGFCAVIKIYGGNITAKSANGAGIGAGACILSARNGDTSHVRNIEIHGGNIYAESETGAAIGAGRTSSPYGVRSESSCDSINITGGTIEAKSTQQGAGIGTGACDYSGGSICDDITIEKATVKATAYRGAGIGEGWHNKTNIQSINIISGDVTGVCTGSNSEGIGRSELNSISVTKKTSSACAIKSGDKEENATFVDSIGNANGKYTHVWMPEHNSWKYELNSAQDTLTAKCGKQWCSFNMKLSLNIDSPIDCSMMPVKVQFGDAEAEIWEKEMGKAVPAITYYLEDGKTKTTKENSGAEADGKAPVDASKYVAKVEWAGQTIHKDFEIVKAKPPIGNITTTEITYGDSLGKSIITSDNGIPGTWWWDVEGDVTPHVKDSEKRSYPVKFIPENLNNFEIVTAYALVKVNPKNVPITVQQVSYPFRIGETQVLHYDYEGHGGNDQVGAFLSDPKMMKYVDFEVNTTNKTITIKALQLGVFDDKEDIELQIYADDDLFNSDYYTEPVDLKFVIRDKIIKADPPACKEDLVYNGEEQFALTEREGFTLEGNSATNVGTYHATAKLVNGYTWYDREDETADIEYEWSIAKATPSLTDIQAEEIAYGKALKDIDVSYKVDAPGDLVFKNPDELPEGGTHEYDAVFVPEDTDNYNEVDCKVSITVEAAKPELKNVKASAISYGQTLADSKITWDGPEGTITWLHEDTAPDVRDTDLTEYTAVFTPANPANYDPKYMELTLKINPVENPIKLSEMLTSVRAGESVVLPYTYNGEGEISAVSSDPSVISVSVDAENKQLKLDGVAKGTAKITVIASGDINHKEVSDFALAAVKTAIADCEEVEQPEAIQGLVYNGKEQSGVTSEAGFYITDASAVNAGTYSAVAILEDGYRWAGLEGEASVSELPVEWSIAPAKLTKIKLNKTKFTYNGQKIQPTVTVYGINGQKLDDQYKVTFPTSRSVGTYTVKAQGNTNYCDTVSAKYTIIPKGTKIRTLKAAKKSFKVVWSKQSANMSASRITGYQIRYSTKSSMSKSKYVKIKGYGKTYKTVKYLKAKKYYYVQVRTYKTVNGKTYYSYWSAKKKVRTR